MSSGCNYQDFEKDSHEWGQISPLCVFRSSHSGPESWLLAVQVNYPVHQRSQLNFYVQQSIICINMDLNFKKRHPSCFIRKGRERDTWLLHAITAQACSGYETTELQMQLWLRTSSQEGEKKQGTRRERVRKAAVPVTRFFYPLATFYIKY